MEIRFESRVISEQEAARHQNFEAILQQHHSTQTLKRGLHWLLGAGALLLLLGGSWYLHNSNQSSTAAPLPPKPQTEIQSTEPAAAAEKAPLPTEPDNNSPGPAVAAPLESTKEVADKKATAPAASPAPKADREKNTAAPEPAPNNFAYADAAPKDGYPHLYDYFSASLQYPAAAIEAREEGTVIVSFTVGVNGRPANIEVESGISEALDAEAVRLVASMPDWSPASINGKAVSSRKTLPISFKID